MAKQKKSDILALLLWLFFFLWSFTGIVALWLHNDLLPWIYACWFLILTYQQYSVSENVLMDRNALSDLILQRIERKPSKVKLDWLCYVFFPLPFSAYALDWKIPLIYMIMAAVWHGFVLTSDK
jgi:hypothetical protein